MIDLPLTVQLEALHQGRVTPPALWAQHRDRIRRLDDQINAFLELAPDPTWHPDRARLPLAGVPVAVKANLAVQGFAHSGGIAALRERRAGQDAEVVHRLRAAGAEVIGTTNMAEGAIGSVSNNPHFGPVRNPRDPSRTAGGSSGGSAAAVAAGMAAAALGSDTMGSVRIPAAFCGIVGLKPSRGVLPSEGLIPLSDAHDTVGLLTRTVSDAAALFGILTSDDRPLPPGGLGDITLGIVHLPVELDPAVSAAFDSAVKTLATRAGRIKHLELPVDLRRIRLSGLLEVEAGAMEHLGPLIEQAPEGFSEHFRSLLGFATTKTAVDLVRAQRARAAASRHLDELFGRVDLLLLPTTPRLATPIEAGETADTADTTAFVNAAGLPAISLPLPVAEDLPVGLQVVASRGEDRLLLSAAVGMERMMTADGAAVSGR